MRPRATLCRAAAKSPYQEAREDLLDYAAVPVPASQIQRLALGIAPAVGPWLKTHVCEPEPAFMYISGDGTGAPMRKECLVGRAGKQADGSAKTREVKLGGVFLQTEIDKEGQPVRKEDSTSYIGTVAPAAEFGTLLRQEARRRGLAHATKIIFIGAGAAWVWELARSNFFLGHSDPGFLPCAPTGLWFGGKPCGPGYARGKEARQTMERLAISSALVLSKRAAKQSWENE